MRRKSRTKINGKAAALSNEILQARCDLDDAIHMLEKVIITLETVKDVPRHVFDDIEIVIRRMR